MSDRCRRPEVSDWTRRPAIVSVGSVNADFRMRTERWPDPGETLIADEFLTASGGKAANVTYLARRLGCDASVVACVGDDDLADRALGPLADAGVALEHVRRVERQATGVSLADVRGDGEKAITARASAGGAPANAPGAYRVSSKSSFSGLAQ